MGIPSYFRIILQKYKDTHSSVNKTKTDYFFIDFNSMIYNQISKLDKEKCKGKTSTYIENRIIKLTIDALKHMICDVVKPGKMVYIAFDGSAPRAKMIQQRSRRFKRVKLNKFEEYLQKKYNLPEGLAFNTSVISPGTKFMEKMSNHIEKAIKAGKLSTHTKNKLEFLLSNTNVPGEGEHKYMNIIRKLEKDNKKDSIVVYSPDADVIVLSISSNKDNIKIMRTPSNQVERELYPVEEFIFLDINKVRKYFLDSLMINDSYDMKRIIYDYVFITALEGNDFVIPVQYLAVRKDELRTVLSIYKKILVEEDDYLVDVDNKKGKVKINKSFLLKMLTMLSKSEVHRFKNLVKNSVHRGRKRRNPRSVESEKGIPKDKIELNRFVHEPYYSHVHPEHKYYNREFDKINYWGKDWKCDYYKYFLNINCNNAEEYDTFLKKVCKNYLESLVFTMEYYLFASPAWRWYYRFRCAPLPSDLLLYVTQAKDVLDIKLDKSTPYHPLEQLFMILPPQASDLLPVKFRKLMTGIKSPLIQYFPIDFKLDVVLGQKYEYSEPILPEQNDSRILKELEKIKLTKTQKNRNMLLADPIKIVV